MAWLVLGIAGLLEVAWAYAMKLSNGYTQTVPTVIMLGSFGLLATSMRHLPLGTAYLIWTGIGAVGAFLMGVIFLDESVSPMRITAAVLIVSGIVLMKLSS